ncbi:MAG: hypothetical protein Q9M94_01840 [Candidatus Gracilibacteria bacterium]|nr:hypothetical protein [Candidatus Gracilibacteria bacterium]MDQ7022927.1 hypothetical protein [Candidatus Gracilibacteria bacterium]
MLKITEKVNIVKIGSDSINDNNLTKIIDDAKKWEKETGEKFIFISSGAVKLGKDRVIESGKEKDDFSKSSLTSIGQKFLMKQYGEFLGDNELVGEILIDDFTCEKHLSETLKNLLENDIWIIINHNDTLHPDELNNVSDKSDNDKNTVYISKLFNNFFEKYFFIKRVIYLTNFNGLLDEKKQTVKGGKIDSEESKNYYRNFVEKNKSDSGTGGMESKLDCGFEVLEYGVEESIISNAKNGLECLRDLGKSTRFKK